MKEFIIKHKQSIIGGLLGAILAITASHFLQVTIVIGDSMVPTQSNGDIVIATRETDSDYLYGDIILCDNDGTLVIKRVIAKPNDTFEIKKGIVYRNNSEIKEDYVVNTDFESFEKITLSNDEYIILGDNRKESRDSREYGPVKRRQIKGKKLFTLK